MGEWRHQEQWGSTSAEAWHEQGHCDVDGQPWPCDAEQQRLRADAALARIASLREPLERAWIAALDAAAHSPKPGEQERRLEHVLDALEAARSALEALPDQQGATLPTSAVPPLPDGACGVMGLCEEPKGHAGSHFTSAERAARLNDPNDPPASAVPEPTDEKPPTRRQEMAGRGRGKLGIGAKYR